MGILNQSSADRQVTSTGNFGNLSIATFLYVALGSLVGDVICLGKLPGGSQVTDVKLIHGALGGGVTLSVGHLPDSMTGGNATAFLPATVCASAGVSRSDASALNLTSDSYITATVGGAAATGAIEVQVQYRFLGA